MDDFIKVQHDINNGNDSLVKEIREFIGFCDSEMDDCSFKMIDELLTHKIITIETIMDNLSNSLKYMKMNVIYDVFKHQMDKGDD